MRVDVSDADLPDDGDWDRREVKLYSYDAEGNLLGYVRHVQEKPQMWVSIFLGLVISLTAASLIALIIIILFISYDWHLVMNLIRKFKRWVEKGTRNMASFIRTTAEQGSYTLRDQES